MLRYYLTETAEWRKAYFGSWFQRYFSSLWWQWQSHGDRLRSRETWIGRVVKIFKDTPPLGGIILSVSQALSLKGFTAWNGSIKLGSKCSNHESGVTLLIKTTTRHIDWHGSKCFIRFRNQNYSLSNICKEKKSHRIPNKPLTFILLCSFVSLDWTSQNSSGFLCLAAILSPMRFQITNSEVMWKDFHKKSQEYLPCLCKK